MSDAAGQILKSLRMRASDRGNTQDRNADGSQNKSNRCREKLASGKLTEMYRKIRFPAPKNIPNNVPATKSRCLWERQVCVIDIHSFYMRIENFFVIIIIKPSLWFVKI